MEETIFKKVEYRISGNKLFKELIKIRPLECECCHLKEWQGKPIKLEVHHKDGDYTNNCLDNLSLLCPNCHSLTSTYKGANLNHGRKSRSKYYIDKED